MNREDEVLTETMAICDVVIWGFLQWFVHIVNYDTSTVEFLNDVSWLFLVMAVIFGLSVIIGKIRKKLSHKEES